MKQNKQSIKKKAPKKNKTIDGNSSHDPLGQVS
jgi:hypothetical protein